MDIIESWVDEKQIRNLAMQLLAPFGSSSDENDEEFIVVSPEEIFVQQEGDKVKVEPISEQQRVDQMVQQLTQQPPVLGQEKVQNSAVKALQAAAAKAKSSGVIAANRFGSVGGLDEETGWRAHGAVSMALKQHLGDSAGELLNRDAVTGSLHSVVNLMTELGSVGVCISDRDGDVFVDSMPHVAWTKLTVSVTEPIRLLDIQQGAIGHGYMHLKMNAKHVLQVVVTSTSHGLIVLGMVREGRMNSNEVKHLVTRVRELI